MEPIKVEVLQSFSPVLQILLPFGVSLITSICVSVGAFHILKKPRRKEAVKTAIETAKNTEKTGVLEELLALIEELKEKPYADFVDNLLKHLREEITFNFEGPVVQGMRKYQEIIEFCNKNNLKLDKELKEKVVSVITIFKDDIVFVMKNMQNFDRKHKKEICEKYISQVEHGNKKVKNGIKEIETKIIVLR